MEPPGIPGRFSPVFLGQVESLREGLVHDPRANRALLFTEELEQRTREVDVARQFHLDPSSARAMNFPVATTSRR